MPVERPTHPSMDARFTVRAFQPGDERQIVDLFNRCFPHAPRTLEHFRWKYQRNPFGNERISLAFDADGRLVGHYAGYPLRLCGAGSQPARPDGLENPSHTVHHIGDTMTDPSIRHVGRGASSILGRVAQHFYETFCEGKVAFNFGFNTANIQKLSVRYFRAVRVAPVAAARRLGRLPDDRHPIPVDRRPRIDGCPPAPGRARTSHRMLGRQSPLRAAPRTARPRRDVRTVRHA